MSPNQKQEALIKSPEFKAMVRRRWIISLSLTALMLFVYIGYLLAISYGKTWLASPIGDRITLSLPIGLGIILFAWLMTGIYAWWANNYYDKEVEEMKKKL